MITAEEVMSVAESFVGTHEDPMGSNNVVFNTDYYGVPVYGEQYPWCCAYVWDIFHMADASQLFYYGQRTAYCPNVYNWGRSQGLIVDYSQAMYGDIVLFDWNGNGEADHIGFVEGLNPDGSLDTLEGNTSDASHSNGGWVLYRTRYRGNVLAIIRPEYGTEDGFLFTTNNIKIGDYGLDVWRVQMCLKARGYYDGDIDRWYGTKLTEAVTNWQRDAGLPTTGQFGNMYDWPTLVGLKRTNSKWLITTTKIGVMDSKDVFFPQQLLKASGYYTGDLDWDFGGLMYEAVTKFQVAAGLNPNGELDYDTLRYLVGEQ